MQEIYDSNGHNAKFIPVIFDGADEAHIPLLLRSVTYYNMSTEYEYDNLYFRLTNQPGYVAKPLVQVRKRPQDT